MIESISLDIDQFGKQRSKLDYPYLEILEVNDVLPLVVGALEKGDMQVIAKHNGVNKIIGRISLSAYNIDKLIRTKQVLRLHITEEDNAIITCIQDYLEVI